MSDNGSVSIKIKKDIHTFFKSHSAIYGLGYGRFINSTLRERMEQIKRDHPYYKDKKNMREAKQEIKSKDNKITQLEQEIEEYKIKLDEMIKKWH